MARTIKWFPSYFQIKAGVNVHLATAAGDYDVAIRNAGCDLEAARQGTKDWKRKHSVLFDLERGKIKAKEDAENQRKWAREARDQRDIHVAVRLLKRAGKSQIAELIEFPNDWNTVEAGLKEVVRSLDALSTQFMAEGDMTSMTLAAREASHAAVLLGAERNRIAF